jgi:type I restriction enzyme S subunit
MLSEVPEGWAQENLGSVFSVITKGTTPTSVGYAFESSGVPFIKVENISASGKITNKTSQYISEECHAKLARSVIEKGAILFSIAGTIGKVALYEEDYQSNTNQALAILRGLNEDAASKGFIFQLLKSTYVYDTLQSQRTVGAQSNISLKQLKELVVNLPPLTEQKRIAEVLRSVDESIQATQRLIEQAERVKQGLMEELLTGGLGSEAIERGEVPEGWRLANLKDCTSKIGSGVTPKGGKKAYVEAGIPIIRSQNVGWGSALLTDVAHITEQQHDKMANSKLMHEDVLLNITGASIGRCAVYKGANFQANVNQHVCILRTRENLHPSYLCAWLLSHTGQRQIDKFQAGGNRQGLNFQQIGSFSLPLPTISEQVSIAAKLDDVSVLLKKQKELISQKLTVKKGLMDDLLTGKVRTV